MSWHDSIEFEEPTTSVCDCCGGTTIHLTRFVSRDGNAFAVYYARYSDNHPDKYVSLLAGFGPWGEDASPSERTAIAFRIWTTGSNYEVGIVEPEDDDWEATFLGTKLIRDDALASKWRQELFDLSDHIVECDAPIIEYLNQL